MLLPLNKNSSLHDTVSSVPVSTGNVSSVFRFLQAGFSPVHSPGTVKKSVVKKLKQQSNNLWQL